MTAASPAHARRQTSLANQAWVRGSRGPYSTSTSSGVEGSSLGSAGGSLGTSRGTGSSSGSTVYVRFGSPTSTSYPNSLSTVRLHPDRPTQGASRHPRIESIRPPRRHSSSTAAGVDLEARPRRWPSCGVPHSCFPRDWATAPGTRRPQRRDRLRAAHLRSSRAARLLAIPPLCSSN